MTDTMSARLEALETRIAYQDETIEELNQAVTRQWAEIDRLKREVEKLSERLATAEQSLGADPAEEAPPPHY